MAFCALLVTPAAQAGGLDEALALCTDTTLSLSERRDAFRDAGWQPDSTPAAMDAALIHALILSRLDPIATESWNAEQEKSASIARRLRLSRGYADARHLTMDTASITLEPNGSGLATCLYAGPGDDLTPIVDLLQSDVLIAKDRRSIRGDFRGGTVVAHALDPQAAAGFSDPLTYTTTFTVVLDRTGRETK